jgi:hypothetical protein
MSAGSHRRRVWTSGTRKFVSQEVRLSTRSCCAVPLACLVLGMQGAATAAAPRSVPLVSLAPAKLEHCERSGLLRPVCPRLVPRVRAAYLSNLSVELTGRWVLDVFNLERGGEYPQHPERNRPPRMAHVVAVAGSVERLAPFREPRGGRGVPLRDGLMRRARAAPISFGRVRWAGRVGALYLMPSFPRGGMLGNHLVLSWRQNARRYALSLHGWEPLTESVRTLRRMVESLPSLAAAERLTRLSPVRRGMMPRGAASKRFTVFAPSPREYAFDVFAVVPARADIGIRIETPSGQALHILRSTRSRDCRTRPPLRICFLHFPKLEAVQSGRCTIVLTKRSVAPARVRVDVGFR